MLVLVPGADEFVRGKGFLVQIETPGERILRGEIRSLRVLSFQYGPGSFTRAADFNLPNYPARVWVVVLISAGEIK